jgi:hypothetical protein
MKKIILLAAFACTASGVFAQSKTAEPTQAELATLRAARIAAEQGITPATAPAINAEAFVAQFTQRYNLNAQQAKVATDVMTNITAKINDPMNAASRKQLIEAALDACSKPMTGAQRKQLLADYTAGMYK